MNRHPNRPLAGGFLTGKLTAGNAAGTRFEAGNQMTIAHNWYDKPVMHEAVRKLQVFIEPLGLSLTEVLMRWLVYHSQLGEGDGVIIGGSRVEQIERNLLKVRKGGLPEEVVGMAESVWEMVRGEAPLQGHINMQNHFHQGNIGTLYVNND